MTQIGQVLLDGFDTVGVEPVGSVRVELLDVLRGARRGRGPGAGRRRDGAGCGGARRRCARGYGTRRADTRLEGGARRLDRLGVGWVGEFPVLLQRGDGVLADTSTRVQVGCDCRKGIGDVVCGVSAQRCHRLGVRQVNVTRRTDDVTPCQRKRQEKCNETEGDRPSADGIGGHEGPPPFLQRDDQDVVCWLRAQVKIA